MEKAKVMKGPTNAVSDFLGLILTPQNQADGAQCRPFFQETYQSTVSPLFLCHPFRNSSFYLLWSHKHAFFFFFFFTCLP